MSLKDDIESIRELFKDVPPDAFTTCPDCGASPAETRCECDFIGIRAKRKYEADLDEALTLLANMVRSHCEPVSQHPEHGYDPYCASHGRNAEWAEIANECAIRCLVASGRMEWVSESCVRARFVEGK